MRTDVSRRIRRLGSDRTPLTDKELAVIEGYARQRKAGYGISESNERLAMLEHDVLRLVAEIRRLARNSTDPKQLPLRIDLGGGESSSHNGSL